MPSNARSIASLTISFGLVAIPVKLYSATSSSERISFNLLRQRDGSRVKQQYVAVNDGALVERSEMTKGYEFAKGQYVMFTAEELKALEDTTTHTIDITQFVPLDSVDPVYFDGTYFLAPDKGGSKPYSLLADGAQEGEAVRGRPLDLARQGTHRASFARWTTASRCTSCTSRRKCARSRTSASRLRRCRTRAQAREPADRSARGQTLRSQRVRRRTSRPRGGGGPAEGRGQGSVFRGATECRRRLQRGRSDGEDAEGEA